MDATTDGNYSKVLTCSQQSELEATVGPTGVGSSATGRCTLGTLGTLGGAHWRKAGQQQSRLPLAQPGMLLNKQLNSSSILQPQLKMVQMSQMKGSFIFNAELLGEGALHTTEVNDFLASKKIHSCQVGRGGYQIVKCKQIRTVPQTAIPHICHFV